MFFYLTHNGFRNGHLFSIQVNQLYLFWTYMTGGIVRGQKSYSKWEGELSGVVVVRGVSCPGVDVRSHNSLAPERCI